MAFITLYSTSRVSAVARNGTTPLVSQPIPALLPSESLPAAAVAAAASAAAAAGAGAGAAGAGAGAAAAGAGAGARAGARVGGAAAAAAAAGLLQLDCSSARELALR